MTSLFVALVLSTSLSATLVDRAVVVVNGELISENDVHLREQSLLTDLYRQQLPPEKLTEQLELAKRMLLANIVDEALLIQRANETGITVTPEQVDSIIQSIMDANSIPDREALRQALRADGMTLEELEKTVARRGLIEKVKQFEIAARVVVTDDEVQRYYEEHVEEFSLPERVRLRECVLLTEGRESAEVEKEIGEIARLVANGSDFAELATFFSQAPSADHGGDMGSVDLLTLSNELVDVVNALKPGEVSAPVKTEFGFHLLKLEARQGRELRPLSEARPEIQNKLQMQRYGEALEDFVRGLRQKAWLQVFPAPPGAREYTLPPDYLQDRIEP